MLNLTGSKLFRSAKPIQNDAPLWPSFVVRAPALGVDIPVVNQAGPDDDPEAGPFAWQCCQSNGVHGSAETAITALRAHIAREHGGPAPDQAPPADSSDTGDKH